MGSDPHASIIMGRWFTNFPLYGIILYNISWVNALGEYTKITGVCYVFIEFALTNIYPASSPVVIVTGDYIS